QDDDDQLVNQRCYEMLERAPDQRRTVVSGYDIDAGRQGCFHLNELGIERPGNLEHILLLLHDDNAANNFAGAIQVGNTASLVVANLDISDIFEVNRFAVSTTSEHHLLKTIDVVVVDHTADLIVAVGNFDRSAAGFLKRTL